MNTWFSCIHNTCEYICWDDSRVKKIPLHQLPLQGISKATTAYSQIPSCLLDVLPRLRAMSPSPSKLHDISLSLLCFMKLALTLDIPFCLTGFGTDCSRKIRHTEHHQGREHVPHTPSFSIFFLPSFAIDHNLPLAHSKLLSSSVVL